jgi:hypothetical protein
MRVLKSPGYQGEYAGEIVLPDGCRKSFPDGGACVLEGKVQNGV